MRLRVSIKLRLYVIIGLGFFGLVGLAVLQINSLAESPQAQRQNELKHLAEVALTIAQGEYKSAEGRVVSEQVARERAAARSAGCDQNRRFSRELAGAIARNDIDATLINLQHSEASGKILSNILAEGELAVA